MFHSVCDPVIHTLQNLFRTSPFLYIISASPLPADALPVCVVASRLYMRCPKLYQQLLDSAKCTAAKTPTIVIDYD